MPLLSWSGAPDVGARERSSSAVREGMATVATERMVLMLAFAVPTLYLVAAMTMLAYAEPARLGIWLVGSILIVATSWLRLSRGLKAGDDARHPRSLFFTFAVPVGFTWGVLPLVKLSPGAGGATVCALVVSIAALAMVLAATHASYPAFAAGLVLAVTPNLAAAVLADEVHLAPVLVLAYTMPVGIATAVLARRSHSHRIALAVRSRRLVQELAADRIALEKANAQLVHRATHDRLMGIPNRELLQVRLEEALAEASSGERVGLLFLDLDRFKYVNDSMGHSAGDDLLRAAGTRMERALLDVPGALVARVGGDEFVVLVPAIRTEVELARVADLLLAVFNQPFVVDGMKLRVATSIGMALSGSGDTSDGLYRLADAALYEAKERGRNQAVMADVALRSVRAARITTELAFRSALHEGAIRAWYQPEIDLLTGDIVAAEALARWVSDDGVIMADAFITAAHRAGLTEALMVHMVDQVWSWHEGDHRHLEVGINVSAAHIRSLLRWKVHAEGERPLAGVRLEIPETDIISDFDRARDVLQEARDLGALVILDDFGTGYSSLRMLSDLPIDGIKIDRSYVDRLVTDHRVRELVTALAEFGRRTGVLVIAEGVETPEQADFLMQVGITRAQGFLFAPALAPAEFEAFERSAPLHVELAPIF